MSDNSVLNEDNLSDAFYMRLIRHLTDSGIKAGDALPSESSLATDLNVGRQQLREALAVVEAFGIVEGRQGARRVWIGANFAHSLSRMTAAFFIESGDITREFIQVRHALETALLPVVATKISPQDLAELRSIAQSMIDDAQRGVDFSDDDERFHRALFRPLENSILDGVLQAFWTIFRLARASDLHGKDDSAIPEIAEMHMHVVDAIAEGDARRAVYELDAHFYGVRRRYASDTDPNAS